MRFAEYKWHNPYFCQKHKILQKSISITAIASISALGTNPENVWESYQKNNHFITERNNAFVAELSGEDKEIIEKLRLSDSKYKALDNSVLYAIYASRLAVKNANWNTQNNFGINIGSSRGATSLFEKFHQDFLNTNKAKTLSSPTTTLGNISSWVAHDLQTKGPEISHSITCSTALHALLNGIAWINSGICDKFLVGGSEAPLTPFTIAQMQALKIYGHSEQSDEPFPCCALDIKKTKNTMVLGEGAAMACLEKGRIENALATIVGFGYATEILKNSTSISTEADCFQKSMQMALDSANLKTVDIIITHTPGTIKGDLAEYKAIEKVFKKQLPALTNNKWKLGHTLGASGMLSIEMAILMLQKQEFISVPFIESTHPKKLKTIMVNAVGFGGNAVSILLSK